MKKWLLLFVALLIAAVSYYEFFYPPRVLRRAAEDALKQFAGAVASQDRAEVGKALEKFLADDARVTLEVNFFSATRQVPAMTQDFTKPSFITFIDNTLFPLTDYAYEPEIRDFSLSPDGKMAAVVFTSREWADGNNYYGGLSIATRFSSETTCKGEVGVAPEGILLQRVDCSMQLRSVPKPGEYQKLRQSPEALQDLIKQ